jgi:hypothetical protein
LDKLKSRREEISKNYFLKDANKQMEKKGTVGEFTAKAKKAGYTKDDGSGCAQSYAKHVLANKDDFDEETIKQAQFAKNMGKIAKDRKKEE